MTLYRINFIIDYGIEEYPGDILEFATKLVKDKTHYFLYLRVEIKSGYIKITGYSLSSLWDTDSNGNLWLYILDSINTFIFKVYIDTKYEVGNVKNKNVLYINCFGKVMSTFHKK